MRAKAIAVGLAFCAVAALALPAASGAVTRHARQPATTVTQLRLRGSHGYLLQLTEIAGHGAFLTATRGPVARGRWESVDYVTPHAPTGKPGSGSVNFRVGPFGHLRGHLVVTSTKEEKPDRRCDGEPAVVEGGVFVGSFRFHGKEAFTSVQATRARGSITRRPEQVCTYSVPKHFPDEGKSRGRGAKLPKGEYKLVASDAGKTFFEAEHRDEGQVEPGFEFADFQASVSERFGSLSVAHFADVTSTGSDLASLFQVPNLTEPLAEAVLTPPAPFSGSATFQSDGARAGTWTGDLAVDLPGLPRTPLTGGGIDAGLCAGRAGCTKTLPSVLQPVLEAPPGVIVAVAVRK